MSIVVLFRLIYDVYFSDMGQIKIKDIIMWNIILTLPFGKGYLHKQNIKVKVNHVLTICVLKSINRKSNRYIASKTQ